MAAHEFISRRPSNRDMPLAINVSGAAATGAFASGAGTQMNLDHTSIQVTGASSGFGVRANNGGALNISNGSTITTNGNSVIGLIVDTGSTGIYRSPLKMRSLI